MSCIVVTLSSNTQQNYCEFCGNTVCKDCFTKTRPFPKGAIPTGGVKPRGKICKLCDRKFMVKKIIQENHLRIIKKDKTLTKLRKEETSLNKRIDELERHYAI